MHGGKPVNVSNSFTPVIGERLTDIQPQFQWSDFDWKKVEKHVNRLQTRITKAFKEQKWHLVRRKKQPLRTPTMNDRTVQMLHVLTLSGNEILRVASTTVCHGNKTAARYRKGYEMLERYEGKLSRTVLR
jgi:retron-type reverse transcriptase